ncbi:hypothetical protein C1645_735220 [Glomus cerebriforme]|uniref:Uncharacterized protein n=1 Tax=Glomus cerebriforme TaxID=658196 RepID=A0A397TBQ9_9GLOM|nr:hypothetical protein C1645_735220 [Glomus cerebriforme]
MLSKLELSKQHITELKTENVNLRRKLSVSDVEIAELKCSNIEFLKVNKEYNKRHDAENAKLRTKIKKLKSENTEFRDHVTKVEQRQVLNKPRGTSHNFSNDNIPNDNNPNNNSSNFNSGAVHYKKSSQKKEMDNFLLETHKKIVGDDIRRYNKEKKLSKAEQASLNQDQESDIRCSISEKISEVSNPMTKISARTLSQNSHKKKGAENIIQIIADGIKDDVQLSDKAIPCDMISIKSLNQFSSTDSLLSLAQLFNKADDAEYGTIHANQEEILCWYYYEKEFLTQSVKMNKEVVSQSGGEINESKLDNNSDSNDSEEEMPDDSDDDRYNRYNRYGGYNKYGEHDRGKGKKGWLSHKSVVTLCQVDLLNDAENKGLNCTAK